MEMECYQQEAQSNAYLRLNHIQIKEIEQDHAVLTAELTPELTNPYGMAHGGLLYTMSDCCAGITARTDGRKYVTLDADFHYLRNVTSGMLMAQSCVIRRGSHVCVLQVVVTDEAQRVLTEGTFTMYCVAETA